MAIFACKLPHGLSILDAEMTLRGANVGEDIENVSRNGSPSDNMSRCFGYGLTTVDDSKVEAFNRWANAVTYKGGERANGKLEHPFAALENGSILGPFKTEADARKEIAAVVGSVTTGFEGLDAEAEEAKGGVQKNAEPKKK